MSKAPSFQWYPKDCDTDENVRAMDDREFGFYMRCLNHAWLNEGLPMELPNLARIMGRQLAYTERIWARVGCCFQLVGNRWVNPRQEEQRHRAEEYAEVMKEAGARGAAKRWLKHKPSHSQANGVAINTPMPSDSSASPTPTTTAINTPKPPLPEGAVKPKKSRAEKRTTEQIERALGVLRLGWWKELWAIYPCHDGKRAGMDKFERVVTTEDLWLKVKAGAQRYAEKAKARPDMILKYLQGWLTDERWNDEGDAPTLALTIAPKNNGSNNLTFYERNAAIRNELFRQSTMEKLAHE